MGKQLAIVEDDPDVRAVLQRSLAVDGYGITTLSSGAGLASVLRQSHHDLVIMDVGLPDVDGLTLTRDIRAAFDVGIIIVSGRGDLADKVVGLEIGADDYITKPFEPREIRARVRSVLRRGQRQGEQAAHAIAQDAQLASARCLHRGFGGVFEPRDVIGERKFALTQRHLPIDGEGATALFGERAFALDFGLVCQLVGGTDRTIVLIPKTCRDTADQERCQGRP